MRGGAGAAAYNRVMLHSLANGPLAQWGAQLSALVTPALAERLTLLINHVLTAEPAARERLQPHAGATLALSLENWPRLLPAPPQLAWRVTPAGLLQWQGAPEGGTAGPAGGAGSSLLVTVDAANPALLLAEAMGGKPPAVRIEGDAQLAGDVNWLIENLRWDVAADLERLFGPAAAAPLHQVGRMLAQGLSAALGRLAALGARVGGRS